MQPLSQLVFGSAPMNMKSAGVSSRRLLTRSVADADARQMAVPFHRAHHGAPVDHDVVDVLDAIDQVAGHARAEIVAADDDVNRARVARQVDDRLPRRIAGADDDHVVAATEPGFHFGRGVVDARCLRTRSNPGRSSRRYCDAGRDQDAARAELRAVGQRQHANAGVDAETDDGPGTVMRAPKRCACSSALRVSSAPEMPAGKPR